MAFVGYPAPGDLVEAVSSGAWDVGLVGADPLRASEIAFRRLLEIDATYLVPADSPIRTIEEVERAACYGSRSATGPPTTCTCAAP